jgi:Protein of unknown function (DUF642)
MSRLQIIVAACALASASPAAAALVNGGFEQGVFGDGSVRQIAPGDDTTLPGWTVRGDSLAWYKDGFILEGNSLSPHEGDLALNLCDGSVRTCDGSVRVISEAILTRPGQQYQVSFWVGNYSANGGPAAVSVEIRDGTSHTLILSETGTARPTDLPSTWQFFSFNFIADGSSNTITFGDVVNPYYAGRGGPSYTGLDDVRLAPVPEASTWALMLLGFAGLGALGLRRGRFARA